MQKAGKEGETIEITVRYYSIVADQVGKRQDRWTIPADAALGDLVELIAERHTHFAAYARRLDPEVGSPLRFFRNGQIVLSMAERLADGDEVRLFPVISGG